MSKKRNLKKGFALLTAMTMVAGISVNVSAATHNTQTYYNMGETKVRVVSTIQGVQSGEQITYLAYDQEIPGGASKDNIVYIDQKPAESDQTCVFDYTANIDDLGTTLIKFGAEKTAADQIAVETGGTNTIDTFKITVTTPGGGGTVTPVNPDVLTDGYMFTITPDQNNKIASVTFDGESVDLSNIISGTTSSTYTVTNITHDTSLVVTFAPKDTVNETRVNAGKGFGRPEFSKGQQNNITTYSTVSATSDDEAAGIEYGILFSYAPNPKFTDQAIDWTGAVAGSVDKVAKTGAIKYKAFGKSVDGKYAVQLIDGGSGYLQVSGATYYTTPYVVINGNYAGAKYGASTPFVQ